MNQTETDLRGHDGDAANFMFHHPLGGFSSSARIIVRVAEDDVVAELASSNLKTLDHLREKRSLDIRDDDAKRAAIVRRQMARMNVANVSQSPDCGQNQPASLASHFAGVVQNVGNSCGRDLCCLRDVANSHTHDQTPGTLGRVEEERRDSAEYRRQEKS